VNTGTKTERRHGVGRTSRIFAKRQLGRDIWLAFMGQRKYVSPAEKYSYPPVLVRGVLGSMRS